MGAKQHTLRYLGSADQFVDGDTVFEAKGDPIDVSEEDYQRLTSVPGEMWEELIPEQVEALAKDKQKADDEARKSRVIPVFKDDKVEAEVTA